MAPPGAPAQWRRALAALLLTGAIVGAVLLQRPDTSAASDTAAGDAEARFGFVLEDVAREIGIDFVHAAPELDARLEPIMPLIASLGAAVAVVDVDGDGWPDLYTTTSAPGARNALFRNRGDGSFEDIAPALGIADVNAAGSVSMGSVWGDYDNDGDEDLFLYKWGRPELHRNEGGRAFTHVATAFELPARIYANTAVWLDYDADGWLDLFIGCFYPATVDLWNLESMRFLPESFEYAHNGGRNWLLRNRGDGTFEELAMRVGLTSTRWTLAASAADVTGEGFPDLLVANDFGVSELYLNTDGRTFREAGRESGIGRSPKSGMNASFGDLLNRGEWALFISNIAEPGILMHGNDLWLRSGSDGATPVFRNAASALGVDLGGWTYGAQFVDLDLDGWLDLVIANGYVSGPDPRSYWYDYAKVATGHSRIIADADNWPALEGRSLSGRQLDLVHVSDGAGGLLDARAVVRGDSAWDGRAVAVADLFNRGAQDVIIANQRGPLQVYRNRVTADHAWIGFDLRGTRSNRSAIGAEVRLFANGRVQVQQVDGGSGFAAQRDRRPFFGLGTAQGVDSAVIRWPSGHVQVLQQPAARIVHTVIEGR